MLYLASSRITPTPHLLRLQPSRAMMLLYQPRSFPRELVERILLLLGLKLVLTCRLVNREFNEIIDSSTLLQYFLACEAAGVIDNPRSPLSYAERLEALKKREEAWKNLKPMFETPIKVNHQPSWFSIYGLTGGAYFLDDKNRKDLHYCPLPSSPQDNPRWIKIPPHPGEGGLDLFVNFSLSEYDLMVKAIFSDTINQPRCYIDLVLLKFSTGEYHPLACHPRIHVKTSNYFGRPYVIPRIVGDNLAFVVHSENGTSLDELFIYDWKSGHKRLRHRTSGSAYRDLVFLSPELLLVPNLFLSHFEVWYIHSNPKPPVQILSLKIPAATPHYSLFDIRCGGMSYPFFNPMPYSPPRPFFSSPENSIITANIRLHSLRTPIDVSYTLVVHRRALLDTIKRLTSPSVLEQQQDLPIWFTNEVDVHKRANSDDGSVMHDVQSNLTSTMPHPRTSPRNRSPSTFETSPTPPTSYVTADSSPISSTISSASRYDFLQAQWTDWGPPISRLFQVSDMPALLIGTSSGQRYAFTVPSPRDTGKLMIGVADFNPYNVRRNMERMARLRTEEGDGDNYNHEEGKMKEEELETLAHEGVFSEDVYMGLKCVIYHVPDEYEFDQLLMDEERLVGLKLARDESAKVLYIG